KITNVYHGCRQTERFVEMWAISELATRINSDQRFFVRTAQWKSRTVLRISIISQHADENLIVRLAERIKRECKQLENC
ncbi:MAG: hypothetical protein AAGF33_17290, partial [Pseudomonadota bacterium]